MKRINMILTCLVMLIANHHVFAQSVTVTLFPGYTWISFPTTDTLDIATALGSFIPAQGDMIQSQWGNSRYSNGQWRGAVTHFYPGCGYKYKSARTIPVFLTFNAPQPVSSVTITTLEPTEVTATSAMVAGEVTIPEGCHVFLRGLCWGTEPNPNIDGDHIAGDDVVGSQTYTLNGLAAGTTYYVSAYVLTDYGLAYGEEQSFTTIEAGGDHEYVDLGLPSGILWATCNVGATIPEDYGDYFAWGETEPKETYYWSTYSYCNGSENSITKYCNNAEYGYNGFTDNLTTLLPEDDAATVNWGDDWRMPTKEEWQELLDNTTSIWTTQNGVNGCLFAASNGNSLFLPAAGYHNGNGLYSESYNGYYWSNSLRVVWSGGAWGLFFASGSPEIDGHTRYSGFSVRPVRSAPQNNAPTGAINGKFTIDANGDQVYFSQGNLQYIGSATTPYWKFADNQWDYLGTTTGQSSDAQNVDRDLFGWGTSSWDNGNVYYQPYNTDHFWDSNTGYGYGPTDGTNYTYNLTGTYANADWGVYNAILNGGNVPNQWRTLTLSEWNYLLNTRSTPSGIRFAKARVNGVNGIILFPDGWDSAIYTLNYTNNPEAPFSSNVISMTDWVTMENNGVVFLPTSGRRIGTSVDYVGNGGLYWTSIAYQNKLAYYLEFYENGLYCSYRYYRYCGYAVRLVYNAR